MTGKIVNSVLFQVVWMACVWGGSRGWWWLGPASLVMFALWQIPRSQRPAAEVKIAVIAALCGLVLDTMYVRLGLVDYPAPGPWRGFAPIWIIALWVGFALTLNHSLAWLKGRPVLAFLMGGVAGPFSFWVGATTWKAVEFVASPAVALSVLAISWALVVPALVMIADRLQNRELDRSRGAAADDALHFTQ